MDLRRVIKRLMHKAGQLNARVFRERKILIISESHILSIPLSQRLQQATLLTVTVVILWSLYSSGRFLAYQGIIAQKEIEVMRSNMENRELQQLYDSMQGEMTSLNVFLDDLKKNAHVTETKPAKSKNAKDAGQLLRQGEVEEEDHSDNRSVEEIKRQTARVRSGIEGKLEDYTMRLENTVSATGMDLQGLLQKRGALKLRQQLDPSPKELAALEPAAGGMGGPFIPLNAKPDQSKQMQLRMQYLLQLTQLMNELPLGKPLDNLHMTSRFGERLDPFNGEGAMHYGIDFQGAYGTKIYATAAGKVIFAGRYGAYGNFIEIKHGNGITTRYGHLDKIFVREGDKVERYSVIGTQGNTGRSSGTHVHYEVRVNDEPVNPQSFLKAGGHVL